MNPLLSIIIPFYGTANRTHLDACIDSIRRQPVETNRYEIIIADDGGKGLGAARNAGMAKAHGTYVLFVDADDILFPNTLSHCLDFLLMYEPDMLSFGYSYLRSQQETLPEQHPFNTEIYISGAEYMAKHNFLGTAWRHIFLREWLNSNDVRFAAAVYPEGE